MSIRSERNEILAGLAFLGPNILGVLTFVVFPVALSLAMAFTDWNITRQNQFHHVPIHFVGLRNFYDLITNGDFTRYLGNTLFFMIGIPFQVAGSLVAAILLSKDTRAGGGRAFVYLATGAVLVAGCAMLAALGCGATAMTLLLVGVAAGILIAGIAGGLTVYRTLFYTPHFVAGVATFILWRKLYDPQVGPINTALQPVLDSITTSVRALPPGVVHSGLWLGFAMMILVATFALARLGRRYVDGESGIAALISSILLLAIPVAVAMVWQFTASEAWVLAAGFMISLAYQLWRIVCTPNRFRSATFAGFGSSLMLAVTMMVAQFILLGLAAVIYHLPAMVGGGGPQDASGLAPPNWLTAYNWAKPSLMIMAFWAAIGSNNMLLYLAALTNVPGELYEAADIDGASRWAKFWNVTWPQLAPTTFFITVMATIAGLQGGFEMARVMTDGGPAGATTTLSFYIYIEGFQTGRLGFASAVAWALFVLVFGVTIFNWTFGNRYVND